MGAFGQDNGTVEARTEVDPAHEGMHRFWCALARARVATQKADIKIDLECRGTE